LLSRLLGARRMLALFPSVPPTRERLCQQLGADAGAHVPIQAAPVGWASNPCGKDHLSNVAEHLVLCRGSATPSLQAQPFVVTTRNKRKLEQVVGRASAIEIVGQPEDLRRMLHAVEGAGTSAPAE
jgi:hypothetical protein